MILAAALLMSPAPALSQSVQEHDDCAAEAAAVETARAELARVQMTGGRAAAAEAAARRAAEDVRRTAAALAAATAREAAAQAAWRAAADACARGNYRVAACEQTDDLRAAYRQAARETNAAWTAANEAKLHALRAEAAAGAQRWGAETEAEIAFDLARGSLESCENGIQSAHENAERAAARLARQRQREAEAAERERQRQAALDDGGSSSGGAVAAIGAAALLGGVVWWLWPDGDGGAKTLQPFIAADNHGGRVFGMSAQLGARNSVHLYQVRGLGGRDNYITGLGWRLYW